MTFLIDGFRGRFALKSNNNDTDHTVCLLIEVVCLGMVCFLHNDDKFELYDMGILNITTPHKMHFWGVGHKNSPYFVLFVVVA